jgi:hypothetical protein
VAAGSYGAVGQVREVDHVGFGAGQEPGVMYAWPSSLGAPEAGNVGLWEVYLTVMGRTDGAIAGGGRSCRLRSQGGDG